MLAMAFAYDFEMNRRSSKRCEAKVPVVSDRRPYLDRGLLGFAFQP
jgi:hypothetical protein